MPEGRPFAVALTMMLVFIVSFPADAGLVMILDPGLPAAGRQRAGSRAVTNEARYYFGLSADPSLEEIGRITKHYPVFRIEEDGHPPADTRP